MSATVIGRIRPASPPRVYKLRFPCTRCNGPAPAPSAPIVHLCGPCAAIAAQDRRLASLGRFVLAFACGIGFTAAWLEVASWLR